MEKICSHCGKPFIAVREVKKYCSDSCKQLAFYKRSSDVVDGENDEQEDLVSLIKFDKQDIIDGTEDIKKMEVINDTESIENATTAANDFKETIIKTEKKYEPVISLFIEELFNKTEATEIYNKFQQPHKYWTIYQLENIKWVSKRFRCLLENILRLSSKSMISKDVFNTLNKAFTHIIEAPEFEQLPQDYPYITLIISVKEKCENVLNNLPKKGSTILLIKRNQKIELLAARFNLSAIVTKVKFTELWARKEKTKQEINS